MRENIGGKYQFKKKDPLRAFYPIIGLIVLAVAGVIGYFAAPYALDFSKPYLPPEVLQRPAEELQLLFTGMIALVVVSILGFAFAIFAPKQPKEVSEKALQSDRQAVEIERKRLKKRKSAMRRRMKDSTNKMDDL